MSGLGLLWDATPESGSLTVNGSATSVLFQPAAVATGEAASTLTAGGDVSRRTVTERVVVPPPEVAVHVYDELAESDVSEYAPHSALETMADSASVTVQVIWTLLRYQPSLPATPDTCASTMGGVLSTGATGSPDTRNTICSLLSAM